MGISVNTGSSRMESTCDYGKIQVSEKTARYLKQDAERDQRPPYALIEKGEVVAKGKGSIDDLEVTIGAEAYRI